MVIEDSEVVATIYQKRLAKEGFDVSVEFDGRAGLEAVRRERPDLVLLDLGLPVLSGVEVLKAIRDDARLRRTPVITFSRSYAGRAVDEAKEAGADEVLTKGVCPPNLVIAKIRQHIRQRAAAAAPRPGTAQAEPPRADKPRGRVLVADDDELILRIVADELRKEGYEVVTAADGREACQILDEDADFVACVFDVMMPHVTGTEAVRRLRASERLRRIPALIMTCETGLDVYADSFASGAVFFIPKPFDRARLRTALRAAVAAAGAPVN